MIDEKNHFWCYIIVLFTIGLAAFLAAYSIVNRNLNIILWVLPLITMLSMVCVFALEECRLINLKRLKDDGINGGKIK